MTPNTFLLSICAAQRAALQRFGVREVDGPVDIADEQITLELARAHCRVDLFGSPPESDDDFWFSNIGIPAAREYCEREMGRSFVQRTMELATNAFPGVSVDAAAGPCFLLPFGPVQSITSIKYLDDVVAQAAYDAAYASAYATEFGISGDAVAADAAGVAAGDIAFDAALEVTLDPTTYELDAFSGTHARLVLKYGETWPSARNALNTVKVQYVTGYNLDADSPMVYRLPRMLRAAMLAMLEHLHANRDMMANDDDPGIPPGVGRLLALVPGRERLDFA